MNHFKRWMWVELVKIDIFWENSINPIPIIWVSYWQNNFPFSHYLWHLNKGHIFGTLSSSSTLLNFSIEGLQNLYSLSLNHNQLRNLEAGWLDPCPRLVKLSLSNNLLTSLNISPNMFIKTLNLDTLDMSNNMLSRLPPIQGIFTNNITWCHPIMPIWNELKIFCVLI